MCFCIDKLSCNSSDSEFGLMNIKKVQVGNDQEKEQSERNSHSKNRGWGTKLTIRYLYILRKHIVSGVKPKHCFYMAIAVDGTLTQK